MPRRRRMRRDFGSNEPAGRGKRRLRWVADMRDGRGRCRHSKTIRGTKTDGDRYLAKVQAMYDVDPLTLRPGQGAPCPTVGEAWERWVMPELLAMNAAYLADPSPSRRGARDKLKTSSLDMYRSTWRLHVSPRWAEVRASDVTYYDVQAWLDGLTTQTARRGLSLLRMAMAAVARNGLMDANVTRDEFRIPTGQRRADHGAWPLEELNRILPWARGELCEAALILAAFGGARTGECLSPRVGEVEAVERGGMTFAAVPIRRQVSAKGEVSAEDDMKNAYSARWTVVPPPWSARLLELRDEARARGDVWLSDRGDGTPIGQRKVGESFRRVLEASGAEPRQFRALRRSWRSWMASKGVSREVMERMMGHSDGSVTSRHYLVMDAGAIVEELCRAFDWSKIALSWDKLGRD